MPLLFIDIMPNVKSLEELIKLDDANNAFSKIEKDFEQVENDPFVSDFALERQKMNQTRELATENFFRYLKSLSPNAQNLCSETIIELGQTVKKHMSELSEIEQDLLKVTNSLLVKVIEYRRAGLHQRIEAAKRQQLAEN